MMSLFRSYRSLRRRRGFTLLELSLVLLVSSLMLGFILKNEQISAVDETCYPQTRAQLQTIQGAVERFARLNDRLPMPASRMVAASDPNYGRETTAGNLTVAAGVTFGAVPFQALGLDASFATDCWGNKLTYQVATALTTSASSGGYLDTSVLGNMTVRRTAGSVTNTLAAFAIISHGEDALGAVKANYSHASDRGWCSGSTNIAYTNCLATGSVVVDNTFNNGKDAGASYFDDVVLAAEKPKIVTTGPPSGNAYCWGLNTSRQVGDGVDTATSRDEPSAVAGGHQFIQISVGTMHTCAITAAGKAYCWGGNTHNALGVAGGGTYHTPVAVTQGSLSFKFISAGDYKTCAIDSADDVYCWGYNSGGVLGVGVTTHPLTTPTKVVGGLKFSSVAAGYTNTTCGITTSGAAHCWGTEIAGDLGNGTASHSNTPTPVLGPACTLGGALTYSTISNSYNTPCALTTLGDIYCWGRDEAFCSIGDGGSCGASNTDACGTTSIAFEQAPVLVTGGRTYTKIGVGAANACGMASDGYPYCWGRTNRTGRGNGAGSCVDGANDTPFQVPSAPVLTDIMVGAYHGCGLTSGGQIWCWGANNQGQAGRDDTVSPICVAAQAKNSGTAPLKFIYIANSGGISQHTCAIAEP